MILIVIFISLCAPWTVCSEYFFALYLMLYIFQYAHQFYIWQCNSKIVLLAGHAVTIPCVITVSYNTIYSRSRGQPITSLQIICPIILHQFYLQFQDYAFDTNNYHTYSPCVYLFTRYSISAIRIFFHIHIIKLIFFNYKYINAHLL